MAFNAIPVVEPTSKPMVETKKEGKGGTIFTKDKVIIVLLAILIIIGLFTQWVVVSMQYRILELERTANPAVVREIILRIDSRVTEVESAALLADQKATAAGYLADNTDKELSALVDQLDLTNDTYCEMFTNIVKAHDGLAQQVEVQRKAMVEIITMLGI